MQAIGQRYGTTLPDQVERIATLFDSHLEVISDVRDLYRDRVALEREYATKLQALTKKAADKKSKMESSFVVGDDPTKAWDERTLKQSTLNTAYDGIIQSMMNTAEDHVNVAEVLTSQVVDVLKALGRKNEETKKKEMQFFQKLVSDRDRTYAERLKVRTIFCDNKAKYDEECGEVDLHRQKQGRAHDDRHAERIARQADQQRNDMLNCKNSYIISIEVSNKIKAKFYNDDLPGLEDQLQLLQSRLVERFTKILQHAQALQSNHLDVLKSRLATVERFLAEVNPSKDQDLFSDHNIRSFSAPNDWKFEPCVFFYDTETLSVDPAPKVFLQNKLNKSRSKLQELRPVIDNKKREVEQFAKLEAAYDAERSLGNADEITESYMESRHQLVHFGSSECILNAEIEAISAAVGDDLGAQRPHSFKSSSFSIPTTCGYCQTSIWGLSKQGKTCKVCGISVHSKCELKVPADSPAVLKTPSPSSFVQPAYEEEVSYPTARVIFDFKATSEFELSVTDGATVSVLEPDDGSGWVKVSDTRGNDGLVPATYLAYGEDSAPTPTPSSFKSPGKEQGAGQYVRVIYQYEAGGHDEIGLREGEVIELSSGPTGGQHYGDGWWEGFNSTGQKGIFPSNYVEMV
ncbi:related to BZZ1-Myo3/5p-Bee1p-Vrp1p actin assembly complex component [Armillaria ostoyae]|uniref:Related to BZZ1-Myo3/5p-Bee1p-Vrp1p actin assembly complex component n=1 Tax=Armillaria ostoyae TaxID=47428 RepID=A0A284RFR8_ARMOS|nr:related to BZZ1-Myo3/5p-Bee1p-Vrp1p actin assembly complex component [Armillaria ostoyae]